MNKIMQIITKIYQNKKLRFSVVLIVATVATFTGYLLVRAFSVSDDFSNSSKVASWWHATTTAGVVQLEEKACDSNIWFCGAGYNDVIVNTLGDGNYILVAKVDISGTKQWKTANTACDKPQCGTNGGSDGDNLVADNTVNFTGFTARNECKLIGGRLPTKTELLSIYANKVVFGNNYAAGYYWSSTENSANSAWSVYFADGTAYNFSKNNASSVRCVSGW